MKQKINIKQVFKKLLFSIKISFKASKKYFIFRVIISTLMIVIPYVTIYLWRDILNQLSSIDSILNVIIQTTALYCGMLLLEKILNQFSKYVNYKYNDEINYYLDKLLVEKISSIDLAFFDSATLNNKMTNSKRMIDSVQRAVWQSFIIFENFIKVIISFCLIIELNIWIAILIIILSFPYVISRRKIRQMENDYEKNSVLEYRKMAYYKRVFFNKSMYDIKLYNLKTFFTKKYEIEWNKWFIGNSKIRKKNIITTIFCNIITSFSEIYLFFYSIMRLIQKTMGIGDVQYYLSLLNKMRNEINLLIESITEFSIFMQQLDVVLEFINLESNLKNNGKQHITSFKDIEFKNVSFHYPGTDKLVLNHCCFKILKGENIGLVGLNGSGKSTIIKLLLRFYDPTEGEILLNGINYQEYDINDLRNLFSALFQEYSRYSFSLKENISLSNISEYSNEEKILKVAKISKVYDFTKDWEKGIETNLTRLFDKEGKELSGGQWQRVALARTLFKESQLVLLDEPSSALDSEAEHEIFEKFLTLIENHTSIYISHRLSNITMTSKILVLDNGCIIESGTHNELMTKEGLYKKMFLLQANKYIK